MGLHDSQKLKYPVSMYYLFVSEFGYKFSSACIHALLVLYFVDTLQYDERTSTALFHTFAFLLSAFSFFGGLIADSRLGKLKTLIVSVTLITLGSGILSTAATPPIHLPKREISVIAIVAAAIGIGIMSPTMTTLAADQFILPQQSAYLSAFFIYFLFVSRFGQICASLFTPLLRKEVHCFNQNTCYPLAFLVPTISMIIVTVLIKIGSKKYRITKSNSDVVSNIYKCVIYAVLQKFKSKSKRDHWLDHADKKFDRQTIRNVKTMFQVGKLLLPFCTFAALCYQEYSTWIFQAARMNGDIGNYALKPDQLQIMAPIMFVIWCPVFHKFLFPALNKYTFINNPLRQLSLGGLIAGVAFSISAIVELNVEPTYARTPTNGLTQVRFFNTLDCNISMTVKDGKFVLHGLSMWQNINVPADGKVLLKYETNFSECNFTASSRISNSYSGVLIAEENKATSWAITKDGSLYRYFDNVAKSKVGTPLLRTLIYLDDEYKDSSVLLHFKRQDNRVLSVLVNKTFQESNLIEVDYGNYDLYINDWLVESDVRIRQGGVYTIVGYVSNSNETISVRVVTVTEPNSIHAFWLIPQLIIMSFAEILVHVKGPEFVFSQAPESMKAVMIGSWLLCGCIGSIIVIIIAKANMFQRKLFDILAFTALMFMNTLIFSIMAKFYKPYTVIEVEQHRFLDSDADKEKNRCQ